MLGTPARASCASLAGAWPVRPRARLMPYVEQALGLVLAWSERARQRRHLQMLSDRMLQDIGLSRADVEREASKPFWRP